MPEIKVCAFYHFARWPHFRDLQVPLHALCKAHGVKGILLLANEGMNATLAGAPGAMDTVMAGIREIGAIPDLAHKTSFCEAMPFLRLKVRLKAEIVTLGAGDVDPLAHAGTYVDPADWNALMADPDVTLIDTRNAYETMIGTFERALDPKTRSFSQFPGFVRENLDPARHRKIAMFCTGGIRCEKASSYLLSQGFPQVYHLKGGILQYLEDVPQAESRWNGACFVFDDRVAVGHGLEVADVKLCHGCRMPLKAAEMASEWYEKGVSCPHCHDLLTPAQKASARERQKQVELSRARGQRHLGPE